MNTTGEPGELCTCDLSSFLCIATETGETASCGRGAAGVTVEAATGYDGCIFPTPAAAACAYSKRKNKLP